MGGVSGEPPWFCGLDSEEGERGNVRTKMEGRGFRALGGRKKRQKSGLAITITTSGQLKMIYAHAGGRARPKTTNSGMVVEYMDRAQGPTQDFFTQNLRGTLA